MSAVNFPDPSASPWYNPDNKTTYVYSNGVWTVKVVDVTPADLQTVTDIGNTTTNGATFGGTVEVGTGIDLNPDGSATFALGLTSAADQVLYPGSMNVYQNGSSNSTVVYNGGWDTGGGRNITSTIYSDGSATFDAGADFGSVVGVNRTSGGNTCFTGSLSGTQTSSIYADGSATFAGSVQVGGNAPAAGQNGV